MSDKILFTRELSENISQYTKHLNLDVSSIAFIKSEINSLNNSIRESILDHKFNNWVFTSAKAVDFLKDNLVLLDSLPNKKIYAVGKKTSQKLREIGFKPIIPEFANSKSLVELFTDEDKKNEAFLYFTGNLRMNTIIDFFSENDIYYRELCVYKTILMFPKVDVSIYKIICFCSPSAVESFFLNYSINNNVELIAIGKTTANSISVNSNNNISIANESNILSMIDKCKEYSKQK